MFSKRMGFSALGGALLTVCAVLPSEHSESAPGLTEVELKAVFLLRLPQFVNWPDQRSAKRFCVIESSEVLALLEDMVASDPQGRVVLTVEVGQLNECDVVYGPIDEDLRIVTAGALQVSDVPGFASEGGMVELKRRGARMGLVVNVKALTSAGLKVSSKLLQLAEVIDE